VRRLRDAELRRILLVLGFVLMVLALVFWALPDGTSKTTVAETTTTSAASGDETVVKTSTTTEPDDRFSDALLGVMLGTGAVLFLAGAFWERIQEIGLPGGASIKLAAAQVPRIGLNEAVKRSQAEAEGAGSLREFAEMSMSLSWYIVERAKEIAAGNDQCVEVDLGEGDKWLLPNLYFLAWVLEQWTCVSLLVFKKTEGNRRPIYVACTSPKELRERIAAARPIFQPPTEEAEKNASLTSAGNVFFGELAKNIETAGAEPEEAGEPKSAEAGEAQPEELKPPEWVTQDLLEKVAYEVLTFESVEIKYEDELSSEELRAILGFPRPFVPTTKKQHFKKTADQCRVALELARPVVRAESAAPTD
jgi:hypothetical protein